MSLLTVNGICRAATDVELKFAPSGIAVASWRAVASKSRKSDTDPSGWETVSEMWFSCVAFGSLAEYAANGLSKGQQFNLLGEVYEEEWTTKEGEQRKTLKVTANAINPIPRKEQGQQQRPAQQPAAQGGQWPATQQGGDPWGAPADYDPNSPPF